MKHKCNNTSSWFVYIIYAIFIQCIIIKTTYSIDSNKRSHRSKMQVEKRWGHNTLLEPSSEILFRFVCAQADSLLKVELKTKKADDITKTIFSALKSVKHLNNKPKLQKLLVAVNKHKDASNFFHFKNKHNALTLRNLVCEDENEAQQQQINAGNSRFNSHRPNIFLKTVHKQQQQQQNFRFKEQKNEEEKDPSSSATGGQGDEGGLSSAGDLDKVKEYQNVPFYLGTICINQVDGAVCGASPFSVCCRQRCVSPRTFSFMCPRLCPITAKDGVSCDTNKPSENTTSRSFCCSKGEETGDANECFSERQYELKCSDTPSKQKEWAFSPEPDDAEKFFSETKKYWADRQNWDSCENKEDGADCAADSSNKRLPMFCCHKLCVTENAMKLQCPVAYDTKRETSVKKYKSAYHHNFSKPEQLTKVDLTERKTGFMPKPYFARGNNLTLTNRVPPPLVAMPPTEPTDNDLHPSEVRSKAAVVLDGDQGEGIGVKEKIALPKQAARVVEAPSGQHVGDMPTKIAGMSTSNSNKMITSMSDLASKNSNLGRTRFEPRSFQEYDPYPTANPVCPVSFITVKREDSIVDGITPKDVAQHVGRYTGVWDVHADNRFVQAQLYAPSRLPYVNPDEHFFADIDGRYTFAAMTTPGGDMGEFIGAMCALEKTRHKGTRLLSLSNVRGLFQGFLKAYGEKRRKFFMQTDAQAMAAFEKAVGVPNFLSPDKLKNLDAEDIKIIIKMAAVPEHVGSQHLHNLLSYPAEYGCRSDLTEYAITVFFELLLKPNNALSNKLTYHVVQGYHEESAVVSMYTLENECPDHVPLVVAGVRDDADSGTTPVTSAFMLYPSAVYVLRQELARFFEANVRSTVRGKTNNLLMAINEVGERLQERTLMRIAPNLPRFAIFFTKAPF